MQTGPTFLECSKTVFIKVVVKTIKKLSPENRYGFQLLSYHILKDAATTAERTGISVWFLLSNPIKNSKLLH